MKINEIKNELLNEVCYEVKHPSGLTVIVNPKPGYTSAYAVFAVNYGSIDTFVKNADGGFDPIPEGTAHFLEHKLFECEEQDAFELFSKTGASANAYTTFDRTAYLFRCSENFYESLGILLDFVQKPYFTEETVQKEQGIIGQEIRMYKDEADWEVMFNLLRTLYSKHPVRIDIAGTQESIAEINSDLLYNLYNNFYNLDNMVLCVSGNVGVDEVIEVVNAHLEEKRGSKIQRNFEYESPVPEVNYIEEKLSVATKQFLLGYKEDLKKPVLKFEDELASDVMVEALCGKSSELFASLMSEGLIDMDFGGEFFSGFGYSSFFFGGTSSDPQRAADMIKAQIKKYAKSGIPEEAFERARRKLYGRLVMGTYNSVESSADRFMFMNFAGRKPFEEIEACKELTLERVNKRLRKLKDEYSALSVILPE